ncbi:YbaN family protein [Desulfobulbus sp. TB]|nr:YbaN family protein [Desulfobulbus sp. TB]
MFSVFLNAKFFIKKYLLILLGWFFVLLGIIGILLPVLPTTPFLLLASALFSKSSPRFHQMLLHNGWFGLIIQQWEEKKILSRKTKYKASFLIIFFFSISIIFLLYNIYIQLLLIGIALVLLFFLWQIKEEAT